VDRVTEVMNLKVLRIQKMTKTPTITIASQRQLNEPWRSHNMGLIRMHQIAFFYYYYNNNNIIEDKTP
jgi:hypothetical protein